ncbi:MAG: membrane protein insertase YidC, partial [Candidatus Brocadiae bacterium]|nr:membrane protein insertase YidC [Candidatus Brocadiia bacterium]
LEEPEAEPVEAVLANGLIRTLWTNRGASLRSLQLLDERYRAPYKEGDARPVLTLLREFQEGLAADTIERVTIFSRGQDGISRELDVAPAPSDRFYRVIDRTEGRVAFQTVVADRLDHRLQITKTVTVEPEKYNYDVELLFENVCGEPFEFTCALRGAAGIERESLEARYLGTRVGVFEDVGDYKIAKSSTKRLRKGPQVNESADIAWAAVVNHYFAAVMEPQDRDWVDTVVSRSVTDSDILNARGRWGIGTISKKANRFTLSQQNATVVVNTTPQRLEPGETLVQRYRFIAAPKEDKVLAAYSAGLPGLVEFGLLPSVSRIALAILNGAHAVLPNYGVAILVLTLVVRAVLHPLTRKSQMSMIRMQKLQPQLTELQKQHAGDKQKLAQEQMALWGKHGVSPMSGCWPIFIQMPVLITLFGALRAAIELRHAGFLLWMDDLSHPDVLFHFPIHLPVLGNEFNLLPILMAVVMFINQRFTAQATTEQARQQQKMMKFMPALFGVLFYHMPSGLCLYFTASMGIGALERWLIERKAATVQLKPVAEAARKEKRRPPGPQKPEKVGWLGKLQRMLQEQERSSRRAKSGKAKK